MSNPVNALAVETTVLSWGVAKWLVTAGSHGSTMSLGEVVVLPGQSHEWHDHPDSDEAVYVLSGHGEFSVGEHRRFPIGPGDAVHIPTGVGHDSHNPGWEPLRLLVIYSPGGPESAIPTSAHQVLGAGAPLAMRTSVVDVPK